MIAAKCTKEHLYFLRCRPKGTRQKLLSSISLPTERVAIGPCLGHPCLYLKGCAHIPYSSKCLRCSVWKHPPRIGPILEGDGPRFASGVWSGRTCIKFDNRREAPNAGFRIELQDENVGHFDDNFANHNLSLAWVLAWTARRHLDNPRCCSGCCRSWDRMQCGLSLRDRDASSRWDIWYNHRLRGTIYDQHVVC